MGLQVDTGRFHSQKLVSEDRVCHVCRSSSVTSVTSTVEDEHHFLFECPAYTHITVVFAALFQVCPHTISSLINSNNPTVMGRYLRTCFSHRQFVLEHDSISALMLHC